MEGEGRRAFWERRDSLARVRRAVLDLWLLVERFWASWVVSVDRSSEEEEGIV